VTNMTSSLFLRPSIDAVVCEFPSGKVLRDMPLVVLLPGGFPFQDILVVHRRKNRDSDSEVTLARSGLVRELLPRPGSDRYGQ
jgi:hypothetical protein